MMETEKDNKRCCSRDRGVQINRELQTFVARDFGRDRRVRIDKELRTFIVGEFRRDRDKVRMK